MKIYKDWNFVLLHAYAAYVVWLAYGSTSDRDEMMYFFFATLFLISAYGRRIFDVVDAQNTIREEAKK